MSVSRKDLENVLGGKSLSHEDPVPFSLQQMLAVPSSQEIYTSLPGFYNWSSSELLGKLREKGFVGDAETNGELLFRFTGEYETVGCDTTLETHTNTFEAVTTVDARGLVTQISVRDITGDEKSGLPPSIINFEFADADIQNPDGLRFRLKEQTQRCGGRVTDTYTYDRETTHFPYPEEGEKPILAILWDLTPSSGKSKQEIDEVIQNAREIASGREDILVSDQDKDGNTAVVIHVFVSGIAMTYKYIIDSQGKTTYVYKNSIPFVTNETDYLAKVKDDVSVTTQYLYASDGSLVLSYRKEGEETQEKNYTYTNLVLADGSIISMPNIKWTLRDPRVFDGSMTIEHDFTRDILQALELDSEKVGIIQGRKVFDKIDRFTREIAERSGGRQEGEEFDRIIQGVGFPLDKSLVLHMRVISGGKGVELQSAEIMGDDMVEARELIRGMRGRILASRVLGGQGAMSQTLGVLLDRGGSVAAGEEFISEEGQQRLNAAVDRIANWVREKGLHGEQLPDYEEYLWDRTKEYLENVHAKEGRGEDALEVDDNTTPFEESNVTIPNPRLYITPSDSDLVRFMNIEFGHDGMYIFQFLMLDGKRLVGAYGTGKKILSEMTTNDYSIIMAYLQSIIEKNNI